MIPAAVALVALPLCAFLGRAWWRWAYGRQLARRVAYRAAAERAWRLRLTVDGLAVLDLNLEQLRAWSLIELGDRPGLELGIPRGAGLVHVSLRWSPPGLLDTGAGWAGAKVLQDVSNPLGPSPFPGPGTGSRAPCPPDG